MVITTDLEAETGIPIFDSIATAIWGTLRASGFDPALLGHWGRVFRELG